MTLDNADTSTDPPSPDPGGARVTVAGYTLEVGAPHGMLIAEVAEGTSAAPPPLAQALEDARAEQDGEGARVLSDAVSDASEATSKAERAVTLFRAVAEGRVLDPDQLTGEVDALLDLLEHLDKEGRCKEALDLARSLSGLLALLMRWAELVRSLRLALRAAEAIGDTPAIALVKHQIGTLELVAGDTSAAERSLGEARELREKIGDRRALAATERNLQSLCRQLREMLREGELEPRRGESRFRRSRVLLALAAGALLLTGGVAGAVVDGGGDDSELVADSPDGLSVKIRAPVEGALFRTGDRVVADYSCTDGDRPAASCRGDVPDGDPIDTSEGNHTFTVTATDDDGREATETVSYRVSDAAPADRTRPTIRIASPRSGPIPPDPRPRADFTCVDEPGGSGLASCTATDEDGDRVADGGALDADLGPHTLTVTARDAAGNRSSRTVAFDVARPGRPECADRADNDGDSLRDGRDPGCSDGTEAPQNISECADKADNDGDGETDRSDPGCIDGTEEPVDGPADEPAPEPGIEPDPIG